MKPTSCTENLLLKGAGVGARAKVRTRQKRKVENRDEEKMQVRQPFGLKVRMNVGVDRWRRVGLRHEERVVRQTVCISNLKAFDNGRFSYC